MVKVGFTGTQHGMTFMQKETLYHLLLELGPDEFHHGDCIGSDAEAHDIAVIIGIEIHIHPPNNPSKRAYKKGTQIYPELPYLSRNTNIATKTNILIATPGEDYEVIRSGTWSTVRRARKLDRKIYIILSEGKIV